jgi:hypothetical protein
MTWENGMADSPDIIAPVAAEDTPEFTHHL